MSEIVREKPEKITKWDLFMHQFLFNNGCGFCQGNVKKGGVALGAAMGYTLHKVYKNKEDLAECLSRHEEFYMTDYAWGGCINGLILSMEEQRANDLYEKGESAITPDLIRAVKTGLMGPLAGFGDTIVQTVFWVIAIGYSFPLAQQGNWLAIPISWLGVGGIRYIISWLTCYAGYYGGEKAITAITSSEIASKVLTIASIMAMMIMGAFTCQNVNFQTAITLHSGQTLHELVDSLIPGFGGFAPVFLIYWLYKKKNIHIAKIMIGLIIVCVLLGIIGVFG